MENYSITADLLNKFHTSPEWIQALAIFALTVMVLGLQWMFARIFTGIIRRRKHATHGELCYSILRGTRDELLVYRHTTDGDTTAIEPMIILPDGRR